MTSSWNAGFFDSFMNMLLRLTTGGARYAVAFFSAFLVSLALTPLVRDFAKKTGMVDQPNARRVNKVPIPRGGGLAVFVAFHLVLFAFTTLGASSISSNFDAHWQNHFFLASTLLVAIGFIDDKYGMRPLLKLIGQITVASWLFLVGVRFGGIIVAFPLWLDYLVTIFWIVGAINAFNLIDGLDGLSSGLSLIASLGLAGALVFNGHTGETIPYLVLAGACLGFLRYNFNPASVFLGDTGSMFLGLCVATLPLVTGSRKELLTSLGVPLLAMGVPIFDTMLAIWRRTARAMLPEELVGRLDQTRVMQPDNEHLHHRVLRETMNQKKAAIALYAVAVVLVSVGLFGMVLRNHAPAFFMIAFIVAAAVAVRHMVSVELWDTGRVLSQKRATLRQAIILPVYIVADVLILILAWVGASFLCGVPLRRGDFIYRMPVVVGVMFVALVVSKTYKRVWSRAQLRDFVVLSLALFLSTLLAVTLMNFVEDANYGHLKFAMFMFMCAFFPVVGLRIARECVNAVLHTIERRVIADKKGTDKVLVLGGGTRFRLFLKELISRAGNNKTIVVGLLDDDINLKGRVISGYEVLGGTEDIAKYVKSSGADRVLVACDPAPERRREILELLREMPVEVRAWQCKEERL